MSTLNRNILNLAAVYETRGTSAVADALEGQLVEQDSLRAWSEFASAKRITAIEVRAHPNEARAISGLNHRLTRMGLGDLQFRGLFDPQRLDPNQINYKKIGPLKWLRYLGGPGVAAVAAVIGLPKGANLTPFNYALEILPAALIGLTSVLLEAQFAWPWLNNLVWKRVHNLGGLVGARFVNIAINFLYGMTLYGVGVLGANIALALGGRLIPPEMTLEQAMAAAFTGAWTFDLALGLFQTEIANEQDRGSLTANTRYGLETTGLIVVNGGRVASWILPPAYFVIVYLVQAEFFFLKTLPQLMKTLVADRLLERRIFRRLNPSAAPKVQWWEKLCYALGALRLINLPTLIRADS